MNDKNSRTLDLISLYFLEKSKATNVQTWLISGIREDQTEAP